MDIEQMYGINAKQSICVIGLTKTDTDADIMASLRTYWAVTKVVRLPAAVRGNTAIVEFHSEIPMAMFELTFPLEISNVNNPAVTWQADSVNALTHTTSQTAVSLTDIPLASSSSSESSDESVHFEHSTTSLIRKSKIKKTDLSKLISSPLSIKTDNEAAQPAVRKKMKKVKTVKLHLLKQFKCGCWDLNLIMQLELKPEKHLEFAELLLQLRTEED